MAEFQETASTLERLRKNLENQAKDMQERADAAEAAVMKGGTKAVQKAEQRLKTLQADLENETRRAQEAVKAFGRADRKVRELEFQVDLSKIAFQCLDLGC